MTALPPQYEIRQLEPKHLGWARAIIAHNNVFHSPAWAVIYPDGQTARAYNMYKTVEYLFKRPESAAAGGKLYWDSTNLGATSEELLEQMDFPLASIGLAYDGAVPMNMENLGPLMGTLPGLGVVLGALDALDPRDPENWKPKGGRKLAKALAHFMMRKKAEEGFKAIQIETVNKAVDTIWLHQPAPFRSEVVSSLDTTVYEQEVEGKKVKPFAPAEVFCTRIYTTL
ncbi:hypothetical protein B0H66DRAFT_571794 [Apodospora peruviana]|uniref:Uncharacterized protein n=1 Tax=Apodospora peruviana TaxID=516989 RepID=A0AAE0ME15_9PEZI|nr:hypothetical protein B0H66DRAFT_571794 [Apodospora peruviana]